MHTPTCRSASPLMPSLLAAFLVLAVAPATADPVETGVIIESETVRMVTEITSPIVEEGVDTARNLADSVVALVPTTIDEDVPDQEESRTLYGGSDHATPPVETGPVCTDPACDAETPVETEEVPVEKTCAPAGVFCAGPFTVPPQDVFTVPAPCSLDDVDDVCDTSVSQESVFLGHVPSLSYSIRSEGIHVEADAHDGEFSPVGPLVVTVPVPGIGDVPLTFCDQTCPVPVPPEGSTEGALTLVVYVDGEPEPVTVPLGAAF